MSRRRLTAEQRAEQKKFELDQAIKDAEIEIASSKGAAEAQKIIQATLSDSYSPLSVDPDAERES